MRENDFSSSSRKKCVICKTNEHAEEYLKVYSERSQQLETILRCRHCGLVYVDEPLRMNRSFMPDNLEDEIQPQWEEQFPDALDIYSSGSWGAENQEIADVVQWQYQTVKGLLGEKLNTGPRLVEIGCARGYLLAELARHHPSARLIGVEPSPVMARSARKTGAEIVEGVVEDAGLEPNSVDAVFAFGSFIQIRDPLSALHYLNSAVKKGGYILLDSPNDDSLVRALTRFLYRRPAVLKGFGASSVERYVRLVYHPGRFYYYTPSTYTRLLGLAGFDVVRVRMRQPRYLTYGKAEMPRLMRLVGRTMSLAEQLTSKESWIEVAAVKVRDA